MAVALDDPNIIQIREKARECGIGVSFGFIEKDEDTFYSAQLTVGRDGEVIDLYRRISPGWKLPNADHHYQEGDSFHTFPFMNKKIAVALCGDLWHDENIESMRNLCPDVVFWSVYTDFNWEKWNADIKHEYAAQAQKVCDRVLYVNAYCKDKEGKEISRGGAALFENGLIIREIPSGKEDILIVEI
ncbi:MAG: carbon-nitrogen hydrolase family protein [Clostridiales bacterium]|nr:carbon-nitrogen hydrolase family protein [Clostridiales bacterium]